MLASSHQTVANLLTKTATALDIPGHVYEDAVLKYEEVGSWLAADASDLKQYSPEIYPQGSFRLGTVVRPIADHEYDIDLVCLMTLSKDQTTQSGLKQLIGDRLKQHEAFKRILSPSRRCWLLDYPREGDNPSFHMDVLPAISNIERLPDGILLTDRDVRQWQKSNPKAYAQWFYGRMKVILLEKRAAIARNIQASVEQVPEWQVKTPLQVAIQLLKRHRDVYFKEVPESRPISIVITTLAAQAYRNQPDVYQALTEILRDMQHFVGDRNGRWWVANPTEPEENFADKWNDDPDRYRTFTAWLNKARHDFSRLSQARTLNEAIDDLRPTIGDSIMEKAASELGLQMGAIAVTSEPQVPVLGGTAHCVRPPWQLAPTYKARISATVHLAKNGKKLWEHTSRPVPKKIWIKFSAVTDTQPPYQVQWQVVNTGTEALRASQLRGDFYDGNGTAPNLRWESTLFSGTHWVEAFIVKNGTCVARSGRYFVRVR